MDFMIIDLLKRGWPRDTYTYWAGMSCALLISHCRRSEYSAMTVHRIFRDSINSMRSLDVELNCVHR